MTSWLTIFDVTTEPFRWGNAGEGLALLALVALGASASVALQRRHVRGGTAILAVAAGLAVFFAVRSLDHRHEHLACMSAARNGDGEWVEGTVHDYRPLRSVLQRPWSESFAVGDVTVTYPLLASGCGYHRTEVEGGPIREGMRVRLLDWNGQILRLEVDAAAMKVPAHRHNPL